MAGWRIGEGRLDDSINNALYQARATRNTPFGRMVGPVSGRWRSSAGEYVLCNTWDGDVDISLPGPGRDGLGIPITISNLGPNAVYVWPSQGATIRGYNVWPITRSSAPVTFIKVQESLYDCPGAPSERVWAEWNELDTSQFDTQQNANSTGITVAAAIGNSSVKRPTITMTATGNSGGVIPSHALLLFKRRLPTKAYRVEATWSCETFNSGICDGALVVRYQPDGSYLCGCHQPGSSNYQMYVEPIGGTRAAVGDAISQTLSINSSGEGLSMSLECRSSTTLVFGTPAGDYLTTNSDSEVYPAGRAGFALRSGNGTTSVYIRKLRVVLEDTATDLIP